MSLAENTRDNRSKYIVSGDDKNVKVRNKETGEVFYFFYINVYGKLWYFTNSGDITFIKEDKLYKYEIFE